MERKLEDVPRSIRVLAAISAGILAAVLVIPAFIGIVRAPNDAVRESRREWDNRENDVDKASEEHDIGKDADEEKSG